MIKIPKCIFCKKSCPPKVYIEGGIVHNEEIVWKYKGVAHEKCIEKAKKDAQHMIDTYIKEDK